MESIIIKKLAWCNPEAYIKASYQCIMQFKALRSYVPFESCAHPDVFCFYYSELGCFNYWWPDLNMDFADFISSIDCSALDGHIFILCLSQLLSSLQSETSHLSFPWCSGKEPLCVCWERRALPTLESGVHECIPLRPCSDKGSPGPSKTH